MTAREGHREAEEPTDIERQEEKQKPIDKEKHNVTETERKTQIMKDKKRQRNRQTKKDVCKKTDIAVASSQH